MHIHTSKTTIPTLIKEACKNTHTHLQAVAEAHYSNHLMNDQDCNCEVSIHAAWTDFVTIRSYLLGNDTSYL